MIHKQARAHRSAARAAAQGPKFLGAQNFQISLSYRVYLIAPEGNHINDSTPLVFPLKVSLCMCRRLLVRIPHLYPFVLVSTYGSFLF
jgi:hypothetical protein